MSEDIVGRVSYFLQVDEESIEWYHSELECSTLECANKALKGQTKCEFCLGLVTWTSPFPEFLTLEDLAKRQIQYDPKVETNVDMVNHPPHYNDHPSGVECIQITRWFPSNRGNAIKYIWRAGDKDPDKEIEDLKKAVFYLNDEINRMEELRAKKAQQ